MAEKKATTKAAAPKTAAKVPAIGASDKNHLFFQYHQALCIF